MPITYVAFIHAKPGRESGLRILLSELAEATRRERGCIDCALHQSPDTPTLWFVYENWQSEEELHAHLQTAHVQQFARASAPLMEGELALGLLTPVGEMEAPALAAARRAFITSNRGIEACESF
jgi:quinol monooxygenase YgiN